MPHLTVVLTHGTSLMVHLVCVLNFYSVPLITHTKSRDAITNNTITPKFTALKPSIVRD